MAENDPVKTMELLAQIAALQEKNAQQARAMQESYDKISGYVDKWNSALQRTAENLDIVVGFEAQSQEINGNLEIGRNARNTQASLDAEMDKERRNLRLQGLQDGENLYKQLQRQLALQQEGLALDHEHLAVLTNTINATARALTDVKSILPNILNNIPMGGLIGFLLAGAAKEAEFQGDTQKVVQAWKVMGASASEFGSAVTHMLKDFQGDAIASGAELQTIAAGFASMGVRAHDVLSIGGSGTDMLHELGVNQDSIFKASLALDRLNQVAAGTFATLSGRQVRDFNDNIVSATHDLITYSAAAADAGQNTMEFLGSVMQNAEQLKLYAVHMGDVAAATLKMIELNKQQGFGAGFSGQMAQQGVGEAVSGIKNMSDGLAAYIGHQVFSRLHAGGIKDPMDASRNLSAIGEMLEFKRGGRDLPAEEQRQFFAKTIQALGEMAAASGLKGTDRQYMLRQFGFGDEGSRTIMELFDKMGGKYDPAKLSDDDRARLNKALEDESDKTAAQLKILENLKIAIADIGNGLLGMILASIKALIQTVQYGFAALPFSGTDKADLAEMSRQLHATYTRIGQYGSQFGEGVDRAYKQAGHVGDVGALKELGTPWLLAGENRHDTNNPRFEEFLRRDLQQREAQAWRDSVYESNKKLKIPSWVTDGLRPDREGNLSQDDRTALEHRVGKDKASELIDSIYAKYIHNLNQQMSKMKIEYGGAIDDIYGFTVHFHTSNGTKTFDGGTGGGR